MIVYADAVMLINFFVDYVLLYLTAVFLHLEIRLKRLTLASLLGAMFALVSVCFFYRQTLLRLVFGFVTLAIVCASAYGKQTVRITIKSIAAMLLFSIVLGGVVTFISSQNSFFENSSTVVLSVSCLLLVFLYGKFKEK